MIPMSEVIDLEKLYRDEYRRWLREDAPRRSFRDILTGSVPYWIILVALVCTASLPRPALHTAECSTSSPLAGALLPRWALSSACSMMPSGGA